MSFFYDFLNEFKVDNSNKKTIISLIFGVGVSVVGNIKIEDFNEDRISLSSYNEKLNIFGENLKLKSISKGEIIISGKIKSLVSGDDNGK